MRFGLELVDLGEVFAATEFRAFQADTVKGFRLPGEGGMSRAQVDKLVDRAKQLGAGGLVWMRVVADGKLECQVLKFLSEAEQLGIVDTLAAAPGDLVLVAAGPRRLVDHVLGTLRVELGRPPVHEGGLQFLWVVDFPLFEALDDDGRPIPAHHPFTMPQPAGLEILARGQGGDPGGRSPPMTWCSPAESARAACVSTGRTQRQIFTLLGISDEDARLLRLPADARRRSPHAVQKARHRPAHRHPRGRGQYPRG